MLPRFYAISLLILLLYFPAYSAFADVEIKYDKPFDAQEQRVVRDIQESSINKTVLDLSNEMFPFSRTLIIQYGGQHGPLYDPEEHTVYIPYRFYIEAIEYFKANDYETKYGREAKLAAMDTLLHTLLHEAGHAYIHDQNIPILGKEEDAVDNFATILLIEYVEQGRDVALSAADMFARSQQ